MELTTFLDCFRAAISDQVVKTYPPLYRPGANSPGLPALKRRPLGAQGDAVRAAALSLRTQQGTTVVGEMGTGKTFIAAASAHAAGFQRVLVLCPPHLTRKWRREVLETIPGAGAAIVGSITDMEQLHRHTARPLFAIVSRERAKLSYRWKPAIIERWAVSMGRLLRDAETDTPFRLPCCPSCFAQVLDDDGVPLTPDELARKKRWCSRCGEPLWQAETPAARAGSR